MVQIPLFNLTMSKSYDANTSVQFDNVQFDPVLSSLSLTKRLT